MSWFSRFKQFVEDDDIRGPDFEEEFDNLSEALNSAFVGGVVAASGNLTLKVGSQAVPGASKSIAVARPSLVYVWACFGLSSEGGAGHFSQGTLRVDGAEQTASAFSSGGFDVVGQVYLLELAAGAHTLDLMASSPVGSGTCYASGTRFTYLIVPDKEP